jgi:hypothetical protein
MIAGAEAAFRRVMRWPMRFRRLTGETWKRASQPEASQRVTPDLRALFRRGQNP